MVLMTLLAVQNLSAATTTKVPDEVTKSFQQKYPNAEDVSWEESDDSFFTANFYSDDY